MVDGQLGDHGHVNGDAISALETAEIAQQRREFIHPHIEFAVGDGNGRFGFRLRHKDQRRFVFVLGEVPVHAVVGGVDLAAHEPLPERRITGVERGVPVLVPAQQIGVLPEAFREIFFAEAFHDAGIGQIRLADKFRGRIVVFFLPPMNCDLSLAGLAHASGFGRISAISVAPSISEFVMHPAHVETRQKPIFGRAWSLVVDERPSRSVSSPL